jgi:acetyl/propionyl-CoA carboxylase alpha subunit
VFPARHVEVQLLADHAGNAVSLHERECSVQRRHQKVLEEAPSPAVNSKLRAQLGDAAVALAKATGYANAGTVEFLLDEHGNAYFLEVNARLQVEHPVTELVTGLDLVHLQVAIAAGASLEELLAERRAAGQDLAPRGWALEARVCAEDPEQGHLPAAGTLLRVREPRGPGVRVDSGVYEGCEVPVHYDSLLSKVIVHAPDRARACQRLARALADTTYLGIPTNVDFLRRIVESEAFRSGRLSTDFLDRQPELAAPAGDAPDAALVAAALGAWFGGGAGGAPGGGGDGTPASEPWRALGAFRLFQEDA